MLLAAICSESGVPVATANRALVAAHPWPGDGPWATEVQTDGNKFVVGQGVNPTEFFCFPCPFLGNPDLRLPAFDSADEFLPLIGGPRRNELRCK